MCVYYFSHFESRLNSFMFMENMFKWLDLAVKSTALGYNLDCLDLKNFGDHVENLRGLGSFTLD